MKSAILSHSMMITFVFFACSNQILAGIFKRICCHQFSLPATSLSRHMAACISLVCGAQCSMPVRLGHWQSQTSNVCIGMTGQWSDRFAISSHKTLSPSGPELLAQLGIGDLDLILKERRLWWYGQVERFKGAVKTTCDISVDGKRGSGRPKMTWKQLTETDRREWKLLAIDSHDRYTWMSGVGSAMCAAS